MFQKAFNFLFREGLLSRCHLDVADSKNEFTFSDCILTRQKEAAQKYTGWQGQPACDFTLAEGTSRGYSQEPAIC